MKILCKFENDSFWGGETRWTLWQVFGHEYGHHIEHKRYGNSTEGGATKILNALRRRYGLSDERIK